jgi:hypothetical protein
MKTKALAVLERVLKLSEDPAEKGKFRRRLTDLLKPPKDEETKDWFMCVPSCFNNAIDIRLTTRKIKGNETLVWTQGSAFSFKPGDTLYDTSKAYSEWGEALQYLSRCISVEQATDAVPEKRKGQQGENIIRNPGSIRFSILVPNNYRTALMKIDEFLMTQDDFVFLLIRGPEDELKQRILWKR